MTDDPGGSEADASPEPVVVDTNVFVAAGFARHSQAARVFDRLRRGAFRLVWDEPTRAETRRILGRIPPLDWDDWAPLFTDGGFFSGETRPQDQGVVPDPEDRKFAALAVAAGATLITNDDDLLGARDRVAARIETPAEIMRRHR